MSSGEDQYPAESSPFKPRHRPTLVERTFPVSAQLGGYPKRNARHDLIAGVTVAALAIPSGMAYAELAGLSPVAGLYALLLPAVAYALLGSSRQVIVGPEGPLAVLVVAGVTPLAGGDPATYALLAAMMAVLVGGVAAFARLIRLGWVADYFSRAVLIGYLNGIAVVLVCAQLEKLFGVPMTATEPIPQIHEFVQHLSAISWATVAVGAVSLAALLLLRWKAPRVPGALIVVVGGILFSWAGDFVAHGIAVVGHIPPGLPSLHWPGVGASKVVDLVPSALGVFAVGYVDGILTARSFAGRNGQHVDANQELLSFGAANLSAGVTQGFPVGVSGSRTAVNDQIGGRTQIVGLVAAGVAALVLVFATAPVERLPKACLGAVIVMAAIGLVRSEEWRGLARAGRSQVVIAAATFVGVIAFGVLLALLLAVAMSIVDVVMRSARPHDAVLGYVDRLGRWGDVTLHPRARVTTGVVVYRLDDRLIFANARYVKGRVREAVAGAPTETRFVVFDAQGMADIDASGVEALHEIVGSLRRSEVVLVIARLNGYLTENFDRTGLTEAIGARHFFSTVSAAVKWCTDQAREDGQS